MQIEILEEGKMSKPKIEKKRKLKTIQTSNSYVALKSQNEIYYQMASVFAAVTRNQDKLEQTVFNRVFSGNSAEIFLENSF